MGASLSAIFQIVYGPMGVRNIKHANPCSTALTNFNFAVHIRKWKAQLCDYQDRQQQSSSNKPRN